MTALSKTSDISLLNPTAPSLAVVPAGVVPTSAPAQLGAGVSPARPVFSDDHRLRVIRSTESVAELEGVEWAVRIGAAPAFTAAERNAYAVRMVELLRAEARDGRA